MADNRAHDRYFLKHIRITKPPFGNYEVPPEHSMLPAGGIPHWVSEACVGLYFDPVGISPDEKSFGILTDDWICALLKQSPQELSHMAGLWIHHHMFI